MSSSTLCEFKVRVESLSQVPGREVPSVRTSERSNSSKSREGEDASKTKGTAAS
jgi:hypothetical protein